MHRIPQKVGVFDGHAIYALDPQVLEFDGFWSSGYRNLSDFLVAMFKVWQCDLYVYTNENLELEARPYKPYQPHAIHR